MCQAVDLYICDLTVTVFFKQSLRVGLEHSVDTSMCHNNRKMYVLVINSMTVVEMATSLCFVGALYILLAI